MLRRTTIVVASLAMLATAAHADWPAGGKLVSSPGDINGVRNARIAELPNGDLIVLGVGVGGISNTYGIQRLIHDGQRAPGWPVTGVQLTSVSKGTPLRGHTVVADADGRVWHSWSVQNVLLESIDDGFRVPAGSPHNLGFPMGPATHAAPATGGEVFVSYNGRKLRRLTASGTDAVGWTSAGVSLPGSGNYDSEILADGSGGALVFMASATTGQPIVTRIDGNGALHNGWSAGGLLLSTVSPTVANFFDFQLLPSGPDHALALWSRDDIAGKRRVMMQRFALAGALDPSWPADGIEPVAPDTLVAWRAIADGSGGAYVVRQSHGRPVGTHISSAGTVVGSADTDLLDPAAQYVPTRFGPGAPMNSLPDDIIADVTTDGNLLVGWSDTRLAPQVTFRLRWLTPTLAPAPDTPADGLVFTPASPHAFAGAMLAVKADGPSGAFIAWSDYHDIGFGQASGDLWMTFVTLPTTAGVTPSVNALRLSAPRPNPAVESVALDLLLPDDSPARVELIDVAGRVLRTQLAEGAGRHAIAFDRLGSLAPGLYFARATLGDRSTAVRVVVSR